MPPPVPKGLTFKDLMTGLADVHKTAAARPGAQAFAVRDHLRGKTHAEMAKIASDMGVFGRLPTGEPVRAAVMSQGQQVKKNVPRRALSNEEFSIVLHPESAKPRDFGLAGLDPYIMLSKNIDEDTYDYFDLGPMSDRVIERLGGIDDRNLKAFKPKGPLDFFHPAPLYNIDAQNVRGLDPKWKGYKSQGSNLYSLGFDMSRAPGGEFGVLSGTLTDVNIPRRIRNALSHYFGHGDFGTVAPLNEERLGKLGPTSSQSFRLPVDDPAGESAYLDALVTPKISDKLMAMQPRALARLTDDELAGYLLMREAQLAGVYGPSTSGLGPFDLDSLKALSEPTVKTASERGGTGILRAFGPNTLGRALTTEQVIARILRGQKPEEISYELFKDVPDEALRGRYAKGGLATALDA